MGHNLYVKLRLYNCIIFLQVDEEMFNKVLAYIEKGKKEGARLASGGNRVGTKGFYIEPTVFADVTDSMTIAKEEVCMDRSFCSLRT